MSLFTAIKRAFLRDVSAPRELDFLPFGDTDSRTQDKVDAARARYGKPFAGELKVGRTTPPSYTLDHINEQSQGARTAKATVTRIDERKHSK